MLTFLSTTPQLATPNSPLLMKTVIDQSMTRYQAALDQVEMEILVAEKYLQQQLIACQTKLKEEEEAAAAAAAKAEAEAEAEAAAAEAKLKAEEEELLKSQELQFLDDPVMSPSGLQQSTLNKDGLGLNSPGNSRTLEGTNEEDSDILGLFEDPMIMDLSSNLSPNKDGLEKGDDATAFLASDSSNLAAGAGVGLDLDSLKDGSGQLSEDANRDTDFLNSEDVKDITDLAADIVKPLNGGDNASSMIDGADALNSLLGSMGNDDGSEQLQAGQSDLFNDDMDDLFNDEFYTMQDD